MYANDIHGIPRTKCRNAMIALQQTHHICNDATRHVQWYGNSTTNTSHVQWRDKACAIIWLHMLDLWAKPDELRVSVALGKRIDIGDPDRFLAYLLRRSIRGVEVAVA